MLQERVTMIHKMVEIRLRCQASKAKPEDLIYKVEFSDRQFSSSLSITSQCLNDPFTAKFEDRIPQSTTKRSGFGLLACKAESSHH